MYQRKSIFLAASGLVMMMVVLFLFGFMETEVPNIGYLFLWILCAAAICRGAGVRVVF